MEYLSLMVQEEEEILAKANIVCRIIQQIHRNHCVLVDYNRISLSTNVTGGSSPQLTSST